ncbi:transcription antitermination factor NusB [candidate division KSB1 bacterium]|nr:transcription antitermination factor NusB [candidate division KSB1 bacterium]
MSTRRRARELVLRALYAAELSKNPIAQIIKTQFKRRNHDDPIYDFCVNLTKKTFTNYQEFDEMIKKKALNWDFDRIAVIDRIILRMAMCEFIFFEDIPPKVSIDEAIEISKKFSTEKSGKFINGILDSVLNEWNHENKINKKGRGLIDIRKQKNEPFDSLMSNKDIV